MECSAIGRVAACCAAAVLTACGGAEHPGPSGGNPGAPLVPPPLVTSRTSPGEMAPSHPPVDPTGPGAIAPLRSGTGTGAAGMTWDVPEGWIEEQPLSSMRRAQYRVPGPDGDGEFVVFYFGPGQGGDAMSNAVRWAGQFRQPDGRSSTEVLSTEEIDVRGTPVMIVEVTGTYANLMVNDTEMPGHMLLGAIARGPDAHWFFKLTGPENSVRSQRESFEGLVGSIRAGAR